MTRSRTRSGSPTSIGAGLWYELTLKPLTNGPFAAAYSLQTTTLKLPKTIDLAAPSE